MKTTVVKVEAVFFAFIITLWLIAFTLNWVKAPFEVASKENVKTQWEFAYERINTLNAIARQVCIAEKVKDRSRQEALTQRETQLATYEQNYARVQAEYDAKLANAFEAKLVKPGDVPAKAPSLEATKKTVCVDGGQG